MFRILIVEDIIDTLEELSNLLSESFPDSRVDKADTVRAGRERIEKAYTVKRPYHAVVLDFRLPKETGENPEADESLCELIRRKIPSALIAHITAYSGDEIVQEHLRKAHLEQIDRSAFALSKTNVIWPHQLIEKMKSYLFGTCILKQMNLLFGEGGLSSEVDQEWLMRSRIRGAGGLTHEIAALCRDISAHWHDLDEQVQRRIRTVFNVEPADGVVRVSLL